MRQLLWKLSIFLIATFVFDLSYAAGECSLSGEDRSITTYFQSSRSGKATFYDYTGEGHCSLSPSPSVVSSLYATVAISSKTYGDSSVCGMCLNVTASGQGSGRTPLKGNYIVFVNNECPTCDGDTSLDFGKAGDGVWDVTWNAIPCPVGNNMISYLFQGSHQYYIKLQARNTRYPVKSISVKVKGAYKVMPRTTDNFFELSDTFTFPIEVQITSITGDVVTDTINQITSSPILGKVQFPNCGNPDSVSTTSANTGGQSTTSRTSANSGGQSTTSATSANPSGQSTTSETSADPAIKDSSVGSLSLSLFVFFAGMMLVLF